MKNFSFITKLTVPLIALCCAGVVQAQEITIIKPADLGVTPPTPIVITGFSGEVASVLNFDLTVMGFTNVPASTPNVAVVSGSNNGNVQGQLAFGKNVLFSKTYSGASVRA